MLAEQYGLALSQIEHLKNRLALADARILELSKTLDAIDNLKRAPKQRSTET
jgi:prefoldin subunit 5